MTQQDSVYFLQGTRKVVLRHSHFSKTFQQKNCIKNNSTPQPILELTLFHIVGWLTVLAWFESMTRLG